MGLPDLSQVHEAYVEKMRKAVVEGVGPDQVMDMMKTWGPMSEGALNMWKAMFDQMAGAATKK
jgi:hypothetical protein